ncbi:hypothetical protein C8T65DRAFT_695114 [Cerioporus squamosus]|nr:hypothetical protein C8T65DRAFT_695114 [Cerioporus squamosus]
MATMESVTPHLYLLPDARSKHYATPEDVRHIVLFVNGPTAVLTFVLPTCDLQEPGVVAPKQFDEYLADTQGQALTRCEVSVVQHQLLRDIFTAYRAFYKGEVDPSHAPYAYPLFTGLLLDAATSLEDHEPADDVLIEIVMWLRKIFPADIFGDNIPGVGHDDPVALDAPDASTPDLSPSTTSTLSGPNDVPTDPALSKEASSPVPGSKTRSPEALKTATSATLTDTPTTPMPVDGKVPSEDAALRTIFPGGVPVAVLDAVLGSAEGVHPAAPSSMPDAPSVPSPDDDSDSCPDDYLTTAQRNAYVHMLLSREVDETTLDGVPLEVIHDLLFAGPAASRARRANTRASQPPAPATDNVGELPHGAASAASASASGAGAPSVAVPVEGGYESDDSMPSLRTVSDSSDSEDEEAAGEPDPRLQLVRIRYMAAPAPDNCGYIRKLLEAREHTGPSNSPPDIPLDPEAALFGDSALFVDAARFVDSQTSPVVPSSSLQHDALRSHGSLLDGAARPPRGPKGFLLRYVSDMADGFATMESLQADGVTKEKAFELAFELPYKKTTVRDNHAIWKAAAAIAGEQERWVAFGRTERGEWARFVRALRR